MDRIFLPFLLLLVCSTNANSLYFEPETDLICPDNTHTCKSDTTCCLLPDGLYGCCMYANAVCCKDNIHCCPTGSYCDVNNGSCNKNGVTFEWSKKSRAAVYIPQKKVNNQPSFENSPPINMAFQQPESIPWAEKLPARKISSLNISTIRSSACSGEETLCKSDSGLSGCCPFPNAVCCDKGQHCCPSGFQCNLRSSKCENPNEPIAREATMLLPGRSLFALRDPVVCPDAITVCPTNLTCCLVGPDVYGCCPYQSATCCADHKHCCPHGYRCDAASNLCQREQVDMVAVKMTGNHVCPDKQSDCPDGTTCCLLDGGSYGCCPYPQAVCCSDHYHCCPRGYTCDVKASKCQIVSQTLACPDHVTHCSSGTTCCLTKDNGYGCCPFPQATCCSDHAHCCPEDYTCDLEEGRCVPNGNNDVQSAVKRIIVCPDKRTECQDTHTCCALLGNTYGCCPYPKATCCNDHAHCCPHGYSCNMVTRKCIENVRERSSKLSVSLLAIQSSSSMKCPDNSYCQTGTTCCLTGNSYQCCPLPKAKCCSDRRHCCPDNFICDPVRGRCLIAAPTKEFSLMTLSVPNLTYSCPVSKCPSTSTCCSVTSTRFACCPLPKAVCCHDNQHCCPENFHCDMEHKRCVMGRRFLPLFKKSLPGKSLTALMAPKKKYGYVLCPDYSECPDENTCCLMDTGAWGCCPYVKGVCCIDRKHCCPENYFCDMKQSKCVTSNSSARPMFSMMYPKMKP